MNTRRSAGGNPVWTGRPGDSVLLGIVASDFFAALAGSTVHLTMIWWVLSQGLSASLVSLMVLCIFMPLNAGVLLTGPAVARFGSRRLLLISKSIAAGGATACLVMLATDLMTPGILALIAIITYGAMAPSIAADIARVPALSRLAKRRLASFHAANSMAFVSGQVGGFALAGVLGTLGAPVLAVAVGVLLVAISLAITWITFPTDRARQHSGESTMEMLRTQTRAVVERLHATPVRLSYVFAAAAIISTAQGCIEVAMPLAIRAADLPSSALAGALMLAVASGVTATLLAQAMHARVRLAPSLLVIALGLLVVLLLATVWTDIGGIFLAVSATAAAASAAGLLTVTTLQEHMPTRLQAQVIGLWQCLILSVGTITIIVTGQAGRYALPLYIAISAVAAFLAARTPHQPTSEK